MAERQYRTAFTFEGETFRRRGNNFVGDRGTVIGRRRGQALLGRPLPPARGRRWEQTGENPITHREIVQYGIPGEGAGIRSSRFLERWLRGRDLRGSQQIQVALFAHWSSYSVEEGGGHWISAVADVAVVDAWLYQAAGSMDAFARLVVGGEPREGSVTAVAIGLPR